MQLYRFFVIVCTLPLLLASGQADTTEQKVENMSSQDQIFGAISDNDLQSATTKGNLLELAYSALGDQEVNGLYLRSTTKLPFDKVSSWPLLIVIGQTAERAKQVDASKNAVWLAAPMDSFAPTIVSAVFSTPEEKIPVPSSAGDTLDFLNDIPEPMHTTAVEQRDIHSVVGSLASGRYALFALSHDWKSNVVRVEISTSGKTDTTVKPQLVSQLNAVEVVNLQQVDDVQITEPMHRPALEHTMHLKGKLRIGPGNYRVESSQTGLLIKIPLRIFVSRLDSLRIDELRIELQAPAKTKLTLDQSVSGQFDIDLSDALSAMGGTDSLVFCLVGSKLAGPFRFAESAEPQP